MPEFPRDRHWDSTVYFFSDPYRYISRTCQRLGSDVFETRLALGRTVCLHGRDAAKLIYTSPHLTRVGAAPRRVKWTLFGDGGVQGMDGVAHQHRKAMFLSLMSEEKVILLSKIVEELWQEAIHRQHKTRSYVLYDQLQDVLGRAACRWAGVLIPESEFPAFRRELTALFDFAGAVGPKYWLSLLARQKSNRRMMQYIEDVRKNKHDVPTDCAAAVIADYRDLEGKRLHTKIAAVELLNVLRPIVAVSAYITLTAHALDAFPASREVIVTGEDADFHAYAQEVRRFYPFFPAIPARVQEPFVWEKYEFGPRTRLLLDIYGTNHDPRFWAAPNEFCPSRFRDQEIDPFGFIPQGGGDHASNHRCPGEWITIALIKMALCFLTRRVRYRVPQQDKTIDFQRLPALPKSRFAVADMRLS